MTQQPWDSADLRSGTLIADRYQVIETIGMGGMGWVVKVRDQSLKGRVVALKLLYPHLLAQEAAFDRFRNEVLLSRDLAHKNLVRIYDIGANENGIHFISMEYVQGVTLRVRMDESDPGRQLSFKESLVILHAIADGVAHAHEASIVHRDLKPENVLISDFNEVKVADFGIARALWEDEKLTRTGQALGTPYYMAPEQIRSSSVDARTDIYALGIIAFELIARERPFEDESFFNLAQMHISARLPSLRSKGLAVPHWYEEFVRKATQKDPEQRFQSMTEIRDLLDARLIEADEISVSRAKISVWDDAGVRVRRYTRAGRGPLRRAAALLVTVFAAYVAAMLLGMPLVRNNDQIGKYAIVPVLMIEKALGLNNKFLNWYKLKTDFDVRADTPSDLLRAVREEKLQVFALTAAGIDGSAVDENGNSALHLALLSQKTSVIDELIEPGFFGYKGLDPLAPNFEGNTAFHLLPSLPGGLDIAKNFVEHLERQCKRTGTSLSSRMLLDGKFVPNEHDVSPIHLAAVAGNEALIKYLLHVWQQLKVESIGAGVPADSLVHPVAAQNINGETPLHLAAANWHEPALSALMQAAPREAFYLRDRNGRTLLHSVFAERHVTAVDLGKQVLGAILGSDLARPLLGATDVSGLSPVMFAIAWGSHELLEQLLDAAESIPSALYSSSGHNILTIAVEGNRRTAARMILSRGLLRPILALENAQGLNAFHLAAKLGRDDVLDLLISPALDLQLLDKPDQTGRTALFHAVEQGNEWSVRALLSAGADPNVADAEGRTVFTITPAKNIEPIRRELERAVKR